MLEPLWTEVDRSEFAHERAALDFVRRRLPNREPWRAWSNFTFIDTNGRPAEVDLLVVAPRGVVLVEIKSYPDGELGGDARTWRWKPPGKDLRSYDNPFFAAESKAKRLKSLLLAQRALRGGNAPRNVNRLWVDAVVFVSTPQLEVSLNARGRMHIYGPDAEDDQQQPNDLPGIIAHLKEVDAGRGANIDRPLSAAISRAMEQAEIRQSERHRRAGSYRLVELLDEGDTWQDWRGVHRVSPVEKRIRIHLRGRAVDDAERDAINRAAEREFRLLSQLRHPGIDTPENLEPNPRGLATIYPLDRDAVRLDHWVDTHTEVDLYTRLSLFRSIAEAVAHAHEHGLSHRALSPRHVWVTESDGAPVPHLRDWATIARDVGTTATSHSAGDGTRHAGHLLRLAGADVEPYLAPEVRTVPDFSGRRADVFALGGLAHLLLTGKAPAADADALQRILGDHGFIPLSAAMDAAPSALVDVIAGATTADVSERFPSVTELLAWLEIAEDELTAPDEVDPLTAGRGTTLGEYHVLGRLGAGASSVVLLVEHDGLTEVLKVARDADHAERLRSEHRVLTQLHHGAIIAAYDLVELSGHTALRLQPGLTRRSGEALVADTLAERLRSDGPPTLDLLQRWGTDLLDALVELEREGVNHRDIKPENLVFVERGKNKETHLAVIDFSLVSAPVTDLDAGTVGYLDPFLVDRPDRRWDLHAERYAAGVVLTELATGTKPAWGNGADPRSTGLDVPDIPAAGIDPTIREPLVALLQRSMHRDPTERFDTADDLRRAWERVFAAADVSTGHTGGASADEVDVTRLTPTTPIGALGLAPRLSGAIERLGVADVGALARTQRGVSLSGVGATVRTELRHLIARLREAGLADAPERIGELDPDDAAQLSVDRLAVRLVPPSNLSAQRRRVLMTLLGLEPDATQPWPTGSRTAEVVEIPVEEVVGELTKARRRWAEDRPELVILREEMAGWLVDRGGVATGQELADVVLGRRGSTADEPERSRRARAIVRACMEAEAQIGAPRFRGVRVGERLFLALDRFDDADGGIAWTADPLVETAAALGERADELVAEGTVVAPGVVLDRLHSIVWPKLPEGAGFNDARLVQLAAAASHRAAVSSRGELYPRGLSAVKAAQAARLALLGRGGVTVDQLRDRVRARFPQAEDTPIRPQLDRVLDDAGVGLEWDAEQSRYVLPDARFVLASSTAGSLSGTHYDSAVEADADADDLARRVRRLRDEGGFLAATVDPRRLDRAARTLAARMEAVLIDLDAELISAMRAAADVAGADWNVLLDADAQPRSDPRFQALQRLVGRAVDAIDERVRTAGRLVVALDAGLLARYERLDLVERWRDDLTRTTAGGDDQLIGLLILVPSLDREQRPSIDGTPVPVVTAGQWTRVPSSWLEKVPA